MPRARGQHVYIRAHDVRHESLTYERTLPIRLLCSGAHFDLIVDLPASTPLMSHQYAGRGAGAAARTAEQKVSKQLCGSRTSSLLTQEVVGDGRQSAGERGGVRRDAGRRVEYEKQRVGSRRERHRVGANGAARLCPACVACLVSVGESPESFSSLSWGWVRLLRCHRARSTRNTLGGYANH